MTRSPSGRFLFTSESVTEGHPDKLADRISDAILDALLAEDPYSRVACETLISRGLVFVSGEVTTRAYADIRRIIRDTVLEVGYTRVKFGFDGETCALLTSIDEQSPDIARGVDAALETRDAREDPDLGAGDQGMMFGFASDETPTLMPMPIHLAHLLARRLAGARKDGTLPYLRPDGKTQITVEYAGDRPVRAQTVVISAQHEPDVDLETLRRDLVERVARPVIPAAMLDGETRFLINPTGRFVIGGPQADTGLTGRKIIVDTYGGFARHGGGAFSGKDPTKVDRTGAYGARYAAKNVVAAGLARSCEIQVAYAIGVAHPVSVQVNTSGTGALPDDRLADLLRRHFDFRPAAIIDRFRLRRPIYRPTAAYGHFGRDDLDLPWEHTDLAEALRAEAGVTLPAGKAPALGEVAASYSDGER